MSILGLCCVLVVSWQVAKKVAYEMNAFIALVIKRTSLQSLVSKPESAVVCVS